MLKCIAIHDSLTISKKTATMIPTLIGLQMRILTDELFANFCEIYYLNILELS